MYSHLTPAVAAERVADAWEAAARHQRAAGARDTGAGKPPRRPGRIRRTLDLRWLRRSRPAGSRA
jgi:hypothetical protein